MQLEASGPGLNPDSPATLYVVTQELLKQNKEGSYLDIYKSTGVPPNWLSKFATGKIRNPSVNRVQRLYEYLSTRTLDV